MIAWVRAAEILTEEEYSSEAEHMGFRAPRPPSQTGRAKSDLSSSLGASLPVQAGIKRVRRFPPLALVIGQFQD